MSLDLFLYTVTSDGSVVALFPTPYVSHDPLMEIHSWKKAGASKDDIIARLRLRCVPAGYTPKPWSSGV